MAYSNPYTCNSRRNEFKRLNILDINLEKEELKRMLMSPQGGAVVNEPEKGERVLCLALTSVFFFLFLTRLTSMGYEHIKSIQCDELRSMPRC